MKLSIEDTERREEKDRTTKSDKRRREKTQKTEGNAEHCGPEQLKIHSEVLGHSLVNSLVRILFFFLF